MYWNLLIRIVPELKKTIKDSNVLESFNNNKDSTEIRKTIKDSNGLESFKYARCLFIDYTSAFDTMQPHTLINRLAE